MARKPRYTLYDLLDASPFASAEELRTAYRRAAREFHPDTVGGSLLGGRSGSEAVAHRESLMKELNEAWDTLGDVAARAEYDQSIGLRRPGRLAVGLRGLRARVFRHRPAWQLRAHRPDAPDTTGLRRLIGGLRDTLWATRLGQWLTLVVIVLAWQPTTFIPGQARGALALSSVVIAGLLLARGGEPTPLTDALGVMRAVVSVLWGLIKHAASRAGHAVSSASVAPGSGFSDHEQARVRRPASVHVPSEADDAWLATPPPGPGSQRRPGARASTRPSVRPGSRPGGPPRY